VWAQIYYCTRSSVDLGKKYDFSPHDLRSYKTMIRKNLWIRKECGRPRLLEAKLVRHCAHQKYQKNSIKAL
jgi:hypothetical protein